MIKPFARAAARLAAFALVPLALSTSVSAADLPGCAEAAAYSRARDGVSVLALRNGARVCEDFANGGSEDAAWGLASGTKSFSGVMAAAAVQDGLLRLDEPVSATLPEWKADPLKGKMTIRQLLSLTGGIPGGRVGRPPSYAAAIAVPAEAEPGTSFSYGPNPFQIFGEVMRRKLQAAGRSGDPLDYLDARILKPLGIVPRRWGRTPEGDAVLAAGAALTAADWARFGEFVRLSGRWEDRQLVDPEALNGLFKGSRANPAYGVTWWLAAGPDGIDPAGGQRNPSEAAALQALAPDLVMAAGAGNQRLYIIPSKQFVVVRQAQNLTRAERRARRAEAEAGGAATPGWSDEAFLALLLKP